VNRVAPAGRKTAKFDTGVILIPAVAQSVIIGPAQTGPCITAPSCGAIHRLWCKATKLAPYNHNHSKQIHRPISKSHTTELVKGYVTLGRSRSLKVTDFGTDRKPVSTSYQWSTLTYELWMWKETDLQDGRRELLGSWFQRQRQLRDLRQADLILRRRSQWMVTTETYISSVYGPPFLRLTACKPSRNQRHTPNRIDIISQWRDSEHSDDQIHANGRG